MTLLFRRGLNPKQVQVWLGHHSPAFTMSVYVHLLSDDLRTPTCSQRRPMWATEGNQPHRERPRLGSAQRP